jgi:hypothetical protein
MLLLLHLARLFLVLTCLLLSATTTTSKTNRAPTVTPTRPRLRLQHIVGGKVKRQRSWSRCSFSRPSSSSHDRGDNSDPPSDAYGSRVHFNPARKLLPRRHSMTRHMMYSGLMAFPIHPRLLSNGLAALVIVNGIQTLRWSEPIQRSLYFWRHAGPIVVSARFNPRVTLSFAILLHCLLVAYSERRTISSRDGG